MSNPYDNASEKFSVLGPTLVLKGELSAEEDLMLKCTVEGSITHTAALRICEEGSVKGDVKAKNITVDGAVHGDLFGAGSVAIRETATVKGNVYSPTVGVKEGAHFNGMIDMENVEAAAKSRPSKGKEAAEPDEPQAKVSAGGK